MFPNIFSYPLSLSFLLIILSQLGACESISAPPAKAPHKTVAQESVLQTQWQSSKMDLSGRVVDSDGAGVSGVSITLKEAVASTDSTGAFILQNLPRVNGLLQITRQGYRMETRLVNLQQPLSITSLSLDPVIISLKKSAQVRFMFGGDVSFGRRFLDPQETTKTNQVPEDNSAALIQSSNPAPGTRDVLQWIRPWFAEADWAVVNLETPVTDSPLTPHAEKSFVFFTLPGSLEAISWAGVDYVSLGNNHVFDYLENGLSDTLLNVDNAGLFHSGAGADSAGAFTPFRRQINGQNYSFVSATSVSGDEYSELSGNYVAGISPQGDVKGGAADLRDNAAVLGALQTEVDAGYLPIAQWHTGKEYTFTPTDYAAARMALAANNGAALVVSHHPHVAQGVSVVNGVVMLEGLGNLAFDQSRLETFLGLTARVDMSGSKVDELRLLPIYIKNYSPLPLGGDLANRFLRRIGEFSNARGAIVYPYQQQGVVTLDKAQVARVQQSININLTLPESGSRIIDLREYASSDSSLSMVETPADVTLNIGRDIMLYGSFEDMDGDNQTLDSVHWDVSGESRFVCLSNAYRGMAGLCSVRDSRNSGDSVIAFRNRIRVMGDALDVPNKNLTLFGYIKGDNAGSVSITARYYASTGDLTFGEELAYRHSSGSFDWSAFSAELNMPSDNEARATRIFIRHSPPEKGDATVAFDEIAIINWEESISTGVELSTPHARDFIKVQGVPGAQVNFKLTFSYYQPQ